MDAAVEAAMRIAIAVARGPPHGAVLPELLEPVSTRSIICEVPFEREAMRHIPIGILNCLGMHRLRGKGAKKFKIGPSSRWKLYDRSALSCLLCTCSNVHAWYFCRFDEEFAEEGFRAAFPENPAALANE